MAMSPMKKARVASKKKPMPMKKGKKGAKKG